MTNNKLRHTYFLAIIIVFFIANCTPFNPVGDFSALEGEVFSLRYQGPLYNVKISAPGQSTWTTTDKKGRFLLKGLPVKWLKLRIEAKNHKTIERLVKIESYGEKYIKFWMTTDESVPKEKPIIFERDFNIWATDVYGIEQINLTKTHKTNLYHRYPTWAPDFKKIAFLSYDPGYRLSTIDGIWFMNSDGSFPRKIVDLRYRGSSLSWAPLTMSNQFLFTADYKIRLFDQKKGLFDYLTGTVESRDISPTWSPDASKILYTSLQGLSPYIGQSAKFDEETQQIYVMDKDGQHKKQLTSLGYNYDPHWSPDGTTIVFVSTRSGSPQLWLMDADGSSNRQLTHVKATRVNHPIWSPDGKWIIFDSNYKQKYSSLRAKELWIINVDGSNLRMISNDAVHHDW